VGRRLPPRPRRADVQARPADAGADRQRHGQPCAVQGTPATCQPQALPGAAAPAQKISFGSILEFDDLRVGVTDFEVRFGAAVDFDGTIYFASAACVPARPAGVGHDPRPPDRRAGETASLKNTEAVRIGLTFENGKVTGFIFDADTLRSSSLGS
jgi:hypothetical protein